VRSIFPKEGAVESTNFWCQLTASTKVDEAQEFSFLLHARGSAVGGALRRIRPGIDRDKMNLNRPGIAAVSSDIPAIRPRPRRASNISVTWSASSPKWFTA